MKRKKDKFIHWFTRDCSTLAVEVWYRGETRELKKWLGINIPKGKELFISENGVARYYVSQGASERFMAALTKKLILSGGFFNRIFRAYFRKLVPVLRVIKKDRPIEDKKQLILFFEQAVAAWPGLTLLFNIPYFSSYLIPQRYISRALFARKRTNNLHDGLNRIFLISLQKLYPESGKLSKFISIEEITKGKIPSVRELAKRSKYYLVTEGRLITDKPLADFEKKHNYEITPQKSEGVNILQGNVAAKGKAKGMVRVILSKDKINLLKSGEILVTSMTTPDFLPAMKRAAAIVTDEGGVMSHAAIMAREFKKPCVIGTRVATRALGAGDFVEVDADAGVVKILKRA